MVLLKCFILGLENRKSSVNICFCYYLVFPIIVIVIIIGNSARKSISASSILILIFISVLRNFCKHSIFSSVPLSFSSSFLSSSSFPSFLSCQWKIPTVKRLQEKSQVQQKQMAIIFQRTKEFPEVWLYKITQTFEN